MFQRLLHVLYAIEFLIALIAVYTVWREVGGQVHLDYMAWYWKAALGIPAAVAAVQLTRAMAANGTARVRRMVMWSAILVSLTICAGVVTYYYHLNEPQDESDQDPGTITPAAKLGFSRPGAIGCGPAGSGSSGCVGAQAYRPKESAAQFGARSQAVTCLGVEHESPAKGHFDLVEVGRILVVPDRPGEWSSCWKFSCRWANGFIPSTSRIPR